MQNILSVDSDKYHQQAVQEGLLDFMLTVFARNELEEVKESIWTLGNMACQNNDIAKTLAVHPVIGQVVTCLSSTSNIIRNEAKYCTSFLIEALEPQQIAQLLESHPSMLADFLREMATIGSGALLVNVLNTVEHLLIIDK